MALSLSGGGDISTSANTNLSLLTNGLVLKPNHRYGFLAYRSTGNTLTVNDGNNFVWDSVKFDNGNMYNNSTGEITIPETGMYILSFRILSPNSTAGVDIRIYLNGVIAAGGGGYAGNWSGHKPLVYNRIDTYNTNDSIIIKSWNSSQWCCDVHNMICCYFLG